MANKLLARLKKDKAFTEILQTEHREDEWLSTNCIPINLLLSGKIKGGIKKGVISQIAADSSLGKSIAGYAVLKAAQQAGMDCFILCSENSVNWDLLTKIGVNMDDVGVFTTNRIPEIKQVLARMMKGLTREECRNTFLLFDSWGTVVEEQVIEKAEEGSSAVNMSGARFKSELANILLSTNFTVLVLNHVYATMQMYGDAVTTYGGKKLYFNCDAIMMATSVKKDKDKEGNLRGKIVTAKAVKGRSAKENVSTHYLIQYNGGINPFYGLLEEAMECGVVYKPKPGYYARVGIDTPVDETTGELGTPTKTWKEDDLYVAEFWIPIYKNETFRHFVETKFSFEDQEVITATQDVMAMMNGTAEIPSMEEELGRNSKATVDVDDDED